MNIGSSTSSLQSFQNYQRQTNVQGSNSQGSDQVKTKGHHHGGHGHHVKNDTQTQASQTSSSTQGSSQSTGTPIGTSVDFSV